MFIQLQVVMQLSASVDALHTADDCAVFTALPTVTELYEIA